MRTTTGTRREPQMGSIEERVNKRGEVTSCRAVWRAEGAYQRKSFDTWDQACDHLDKMAIAIREGERPQVVTKTRTPFEQVAQTWLETLPASKRKRPGYHLSGQLIPAFGKRPIAEINQDEIQRWVNDISDDPSADCDACEDAQVDAMDDDARCEEHAHLKLAAPESVRNYYTTLGQLMRWAARNGYLQFGVPLGKGMHQLPTADSRMIFLEEEQIDHLLRVAHRKFPAHFAMVHLDAHTGMRLGELINLERPDYNPEEGYVMVVSRRRGRTKSRRSRQVRLFPCCIEVLDQHLAGHEYTRIFPAPAGGKIRPGNWRRRVWYPLLREAGMEYVDGDRLHFHDLRHSHISLLLRARWRPEVVAQRVGHKSTQVMWDVYSHTTSEDQRREMAERGLGG
jgi:integrase